MISQDISEIYLILQNVSDVVVLQSDVLFSGLPVALQHDLGPNFAVTDVSSHMGVSTGRTETTAPQGRDLVFAAAL